MSKSRLVLPVRFLAIVTVLTAIIAGGLGHVLAQQSPPPSRPPIEDRKEGEEDEIKRRHEWFFSTRRAGTASVKDLARLRHAGVLVTRSALDAQRLRRSVSVDGESKSWVSMGPSPSKFGGWTFGNVSGRVPSIAADWAGKVLYAGTASGGLWKSTDDGLSWTHLFDTAGTQTVGAVAIDPNDPNVIWAGTGENVFDCESYFGIGLLRSADGGITWEVRNGTGGNTLDDLASFANVIVDPRDSNRIVTGGRIRGCSNGAQQIGGLYTSDDGGLTWTPRLADTAIYEIARDPSVFDILWAATSQGVYKSVDNGVTWTLQTNSGLPHGSTDRTELAIAPSDGNIVYALFSSPQTTLWRTTDGGATWTQMSSDDNACDGQCWYNMVLRVHPTNPSIVYRGTIHIFKSLDGGATWTDLSNEWGESQKVHQDTHDLLMDPNDPDTFYVGCDGGVWKTTDGGANFINLNGNLSVTQFYAIDVQADDPGTICGGAQDNSSLARTNSDVWDLQEVTGDGFVCQLDPQDPDYAYIASYPWGGYPAVYRSTTGAVGSFSVISGAGSGIVPFDRSNWVTPYLLDPNNPATLYLGTHRVYRSTNHGTSWTQVGPADLTGGGGSLIALELNRNYSTYLFSGSTSGRVWRSADRGSSWTDISAGLPPRSINDIASDPTNPDRAFAVVGGFNTPHLWEWSAVSAAWIARGSDLPNVPANTVLMLTDRDILVGTDTGIFRSRDGGVSFQPYMDGLPEGLVVTDLKYSPLQSVVTAGTYGRGAWQVSVDVDMPPVVHYHSFELPLVEVAGDGDGDVERGETWSVRPILKNGGGASALGVAARLETTAVGVTVLDSGPRPYGDLAPAASSAVASAYRFALDPSSCSREIAFGVADITSTNAPGAYRDAPDAFTVLSVCPLLRYHGFSNLTEIEGNANGGIDPGETWELTVNLRNDGNEPAVGVTADLVPDPASPVAVTMLHAGSTYPDLAVGAVAPSHLAYRFRVDGSAPCGESISLGLTARSTDPATPYPIEAGAIRLHVGGTGPATRVFYDDFEGPAAWGGDGDWQIDIPRGLGGPIPDPTDGYAGPHVLGTDLTGLGLVPGNYETNSFGQDIAGSRGFDFSRFRHLSVSYARWLNVGAGDIASFEVYWETAPYEWTYRTLYSSTAAADSSWTVDSPIDIPEADGRNPVLFYFRIEGDSQVTASGWNIDAFEVRGVSVDSCEPYAPPVVRYDSYTGLTEIDGNGNAVVEPGETWEMFVRLRNDGPVPAGGVSADLTVDPATPGLVFLLQDSSHYGTIDPGQVVSSLEAYRFRLGDDFPCGGEVVLSVSGITSTAPAGSHPDAVGVIRIPVGNSGESVTLFSDGFEPRTSGPFWEADGEWQDERPRGLGTPQADPPSAYEGQYVLGTDLTGLGPSPGNYENEVASSVYSPSIPVSGSVPTEIRFAHWINLAQGDYATMRVDSDVPGDEKSFQWSGRSASSWTVEPFDISDMAPHKNWLRVQILLQSDAQSTSSGWNMDAFEVRGQRPTCQAFDRTLPGEASNLLVRNGSEGLLTLDWSADCGAATTYGIYRGDLRAGYGSIVAEPGMCAVTGTSAPIPLGSGDAAFFLVVPHKEGEEGSYGTDSARIPRPPAVGGCYPQGAVAVCAP